MRPPPIFLEALEGKEVLTPPNPSSALFVGAAGMDWEHFDPDFMPMVEISSTVGSSEYLWAPPQKQDRALAERTVHHALGPLGLKFGI